MTACAQPGCAGEIQDGYCDVCGMAETAAAPAHSASTGSARTTGSSRTGSARTGPRGSTGTTRRGLLGVGLVEVPPVPYRDPATAVLADPQVPPHKRFCSNCGSQVGRGREGQPARSSGYCRTCGNRYSFTPKLVAGELVARQYEVLGCLAHGGLGWIYLARDRNVSDRWVVLKGLLDSGDADAMAAAMAERQFLAAVEHPNIVKIYNFVQHPDPDTGLLVGYIVMEYIGGQSLKEMAASHRLPNGRPDPMPIGQAIAYALEVLRALGYLHSLGLVYCDFKPDNVIQSEEQLKLIDLGGVRRIDDEEGAIYGTVGYQAPEVAEAGPSVSSDLYTVARTLAVLTFDFRGYSGDYAASLPPQEQVPVLAEHESYYRLLRRATDPDPGRRFDSATDLAEQLTGVLREVLAAGDGQQRAAPSALFEPELRTVAIADQLPAPDVAAGGLPAPFADPSETGLHLARSLIGAGQHERASIQLAEFADPSDWRVDWYRGLIELAAGRPARPWFDQVYDLLPGEAAPKLALAMDAELSGDLGTAARYYERVWTTDHSHVTAAFGLARVRLAQADQASAIRVLDSVPASSFHFTQAQVAAISARVELGSAAEVIEAGQRLEALGLDAERREQAEAAVLESALSIARAGTWPTGVPGWDHRILGQGVSEHDLRLGLERTYRTLAHLARDAADRIALVERANSVRPRSFV